MISSSDSFSTVALKNFYAILPKGNAKLKNKFFRHNKCSKVKDNFEYSSEKNGKFLTINELKILIKEHEKKI